MNDDVNLLSDELHELGDGIGPSSSAAARDRARRGIARRTRNRRAAMGGAGVVVIVVATVFVAVDRTHDDTARPIGTTSQPSATSSPTAGASSTTAPTTTVAGSPIVSTIPSMPDGVTSKASYAKTFAWGTRTRELAFQVPHGEGVSGGPVAFTADAAGNIIVLDQSSSRIAWFEHGSAAAVHIALASPAVTAAVFDPEGRVIVATVTNLAVYGLKGQAEGAWTGMSNTAITTLEVIDRQVYSVADGNTRTLLLREVRDSLGYTPVRGSAPEPAAIAVHIGADFHSVVMTVISSGRQYRITTSDPVTTAKAVKLLPDGTLTFVLGLVSGGQGPDQPSTYVLGRIDRTGHAEYAPIVVSPGYLVNGPTFVINNDGLAVMGSTTTGGVTVSYYPFD